MRCLVLHWHTGRTLAWMRHYFCSVVYSLAQDRSMTLLTWTYSERLLWNILTSLLTEWWVATVVLHFLNGCKCTKMQNFRLMKNILDMYTCIMYFVYGLLLSLTESAQLASNSCRRERLWKPSYIARWWMEEQEECSFSCFQCSQDEAGVLF